jgi:hypothetical protein
MSAFEFITIFFALLVGLAISHLLSALVNLIQVHNRVKTYWVNSIWVVTVFIWDVFAWWGLWDLRKMEMWTYPIFFLQVLNLCGIYLMTTLVLPKVSDSSEIDLENHYFLVRKMFFLTLAWNFGSIVLINHVLFGKAIFSSFTIMPLLLAFCSLLGVFTSSRRYHGFVSIFCFVSLLIFMSLDTNIIN